jgi:hypothetical protein
MAIILITFLKGISPRQALDMFYKSQTYLEMREGVSDMHCRSDIYLAEEIIREAQGIL